MHTARELMDRYNEWRNHTNHIFQLREKGRYIRPLKLTPDRKKALQAMMGFCSDRSIDPEMWLYSMFKQRKWLFAPRFDHLCSTKHLPNFQKLRNVEFLTQSAQRDAARAAELSGRAYDCNRDMSATSEALKSRYLSLHDPEGCMREMRSRTFGYHPKSLVCARCPMAQACKQQLQATVTFDIIALREGRLTAEHCRDQAMRASHHVGTTGT